VVRRVQDPRARRAGARSAGPLPGSSQVRWLDSALVQIVGAILLLVLNIFLGLMLIRLVVDWVQVFARSWSPKGVVLVLLEVVYSITDPPIMFVRRFVPPLRLGAVMLDTSFLIVLIVVYLLRILVDNIFL
jgi:YggT family protein